MAPTPLSQLISEVRPWCCAWCQRNTAADCAAQGRGSRPSTSCNPHCPENPAVWVAGQATPQVQPYCMKALDRGHIFTLLPGTPSATPGSHWEALLTCVRGLAGPPLRWVAMVNSSFLQQHGELQDAPLVLWHLSEPSWMSWPGLCWHSVSVSSMQ